LQSLPVAACAGIAIDSNVRINAEAIPKLRKRFLINAIFFFPFLKHLVGYHSSNRGG
jgi:hypothetical protein